MWVNLSIVWRCDCATNENASWANIYASFICSPHSFAMLSPTGNYAHGKEELKFRNTTLRQMESAGRIVNANTYLARPCMNWVMTGACPFGRRCAAIHDPLISGPLDCPAWLPIATAKTNARVIIDRLAAHRDSSVHQENPLISQTIWENCRPSPTHQRGTAENTVQGVGSPTDLEQVWKDTYQLVCNSGVSISGEEKNIKNVPSQNLTDLQKLCIVRLMHVEQNPLQENHRQDYVFAPTHSLHSELCMILQTRYFFMPDAAYTDADDVLCNDVVKEISMDEFMVFIGKKIIAHEVAFAPKGDYFANVSIWFNASPISLEPSMIKRSRRVKQKKKVQIRNEHTHPNANGALISRTSFADFPYGIPGIEPFVPMSPAYDCPESHELIMSIFEHRIDSIIVKNCSSVNEEQSKRLDARMRQLREKFLFVNKFHETWMWPKREGMGNVTASTKAPPGNIMPYIPLKSSKASPCVLVWNSFVQSFHGMEDRSGNVDDSKRLSVFPTLGSGTPLTIEAEPLPHILSNSSKKKLIPTKYCETWKELLLGEPADGIWETAVRLDNKKRQEVSPMSVAPNARNTPLSTIPFVQL